MAFMKYHTILWSDLAVISTGKNFVKKKKKSGKFSYFKYLPLITLFLAHLLYSHS